MNDLTRIEDKIDKILDTLSDQASTLAKHGVLHEQNAKELATHIARTNALEEHMEAEHRSLNKQLDTALLPIRAAKLLVAVALGLTAIITLYSMIK